MLILINDKLVLWAHRQQQDSHPLSSPRTERRELTENIMEQLLWLSMKAIWLWQNTRSLNSQVGFFIWLLFKRSKATSVLQCGHPSPTIQTCLWFLTQGNEGELISEAKWFYVYLHRKTSPFSHTQLQTGALQSQALLFHIFQQTAWNS